MKAGDLVRFVRSRVTHEGSSLGIFLRDDAIGIVLRKVKHFPAMWLVSFPVMGGSDGYLESWLEVIDETTITKR